MTKKIKILTIGHSYVVAANRNFMQELARDPRFDITLVAPKFMDAALRPITVEEEKSPLKLIALNALFTKYIHIFFYLGLGRLLKKEKYDIVHIWEEPYILSGLQAAFLCRRHKIPYVFSSYQNLNKRYPWPFSWIETYVVKHAKAWIAWASQVYENLLLRGYDKDKGHLIYPGIDGNVFYPAEDKKQLRQELSLPEVTTIAFVARLVPDKGVDILLKSLEQVRAPWQLLILGAGPLKDKILEWASEKGFIDRVRLMLLKHDEVPRYLRACDILIAPSQTMPNWKEQFGRMLVEAFASKVAVIGSDSGEIPRVIGEAGIVCGEKNVAAFTSALELLLSDENKRNELSQQGYDRFKNNFSLETLVKKHAELFQSLSN